MDPVHALYWLQQCTSQVLRLSTGFSYNVLSLGTKPDGPWARTVLALADIDAGEVSGEVLPRHPEHTVVLGTTPAKKLLASGCSWQVGTVRQVIGAKPLWLISYEHDVLATGST
jgi:hypothetical protein